MNAENFNVKTLLKMAHSPVKNYAIPGLTSSLIGGLSERGVVRIFQNERDHQESITPHSHRFDFMCWVLRGYVINRVWKSASTFAADADEYQKTILRYSGEIGCYEKEVSEIGKWGYVDTEYSEGHCYHMKADEIHSIQFSRGAIVLFFEGATASDTSVVLEPVVDGETVPTFKVEPWMFKKPQPPQRTE